MFSIKVCIPSRDPVSGSILQKHKELTQWHAAWLIDDGLQTIQIVNIQIKCKHSETLKSI